MIFRRNSFGLAVLLLGVLVILAGCAASGTNEYSLYKNFSSISSKSIQSKDLQPGTPIIGVLLKYTGEGAYNADVKPMDDKTFCLYCLFGDIGKNGDGMQFNYVLYVPEEIQTKFAAGGGINSSSGDPFWWYMSTYLGLSMSAIRADWNSALSLLLDNSGLPIANASDVSGFWKTN